MNHLIPQLGHESMMHLQNGNLLEAEKSLSKILKIDPNEINALKLYGYVLTQKKNLRGAINTLNKALKLTPKDPELLFNIAKAYFDIKEFDQAINLYRQFITLSGNKYEVFLDIGSAYSALSKFQDAINYLDKAIEIDKNNSAAYNNKANILSKTGRYEEALKTIEQAILLSPDGAIAWNNKCDILLKMQNFDDALIAAKISLEFNPNLIEAYVNLGNTLIAMKRYNEGIKIYQEIIKLEPGNSQNWIHLANALIPLKRYEDALRNIDRALTININLCHTKGVRLYLLALLCNWNSTYSTSISKLNEEKDVIKDFSSPFPLLALVDKPELHRKIATLFSQEKFPINNTLGPILKNENGKIRIAYFSADFRNHPIGFLSAELYELHDRSKFEVFGFYFGPRAQDEIHQRISKSFDHFIDATNMSDESIARLSRDFQIDIAIDLGGYTQDSRTGIFAYRTAPIQVGYLGYLGTSGASYFDYLISDKILTPPSFDIYFSEKLIRLHSYQINDRKRIVSEKIFTKSSLGLSEDTFVFCCLNASYKITPDIFIAWIEILKEVKDSVLLLLADNPTATSNLHRFANSRGVNENRIIFVEKLAPADYLARYRAADLFLDTFPYNAGTTASDALWAGLPVLTLSGKSFASRIAASALTAIDLPELITTSVAEYQSKAIELSENASMLAHIKNKLRENKLNTRLFDSPGFAKNLENAFSKIYLNLRNGSPPESISVN